MMSVITRSYTKSAVKVSPVPLSCQELPAKKIKAKSKVCTSLLQVLLPLHTFFLKPHLVYWNIANNKDILHKYVTISDQYQ